MTGRETTLQHKQTNRRMNTCMIHERQERIRALLKCPENNVRLVHVIIYRCSNKYYVRSYMKMTEVTYGKNIQTTGS